MVVYPLQIIEEITKKTLEGVVTTYMVHGGEKMKDPIKITDIDGEIFESAEKAKQVLIDKATAGITSRINTAIKSAKEWYPTGFESSSSDSLNLIKVQNNPALPQEPIVDDDTMMEVPDGNGGVVMAKIKGVVLPDSLS